jgi:hypothetical protein
MVPECQYNQHIDSLNIDICFASRDLCVLPVTDHVIVVGLVLFLVYK